MPPSSLKCPLPPLLCPGPSGPRSAGASVQGLTDRNQGTCQPVPSAALGKSSRPRSFRPLTEPGSLQL